ncbi:MAG TPA: hypothetical protein VFN97_19355 [Actinospica sp.]|nr:hypothetical protein [Actinospica sp.]
MTRTLVRRLATAGGALGIALALTAGPAVASAAPSAPTSKVTATVTTNTADNDHTDCPHRGLLGDVIVDVVHIVADLLGGLL